MNTNFLLHQLASKTYNPQSMCNWLCSMSQPRTDLQAFCMNHKHNKVTEQTKDPNISKTFFFRSLTHMQQASS